MSDIRNSLRRLIARYGLQAVHTELQAEMRETYDFLRHMYEPPKNNLVIPLAHTIPDRIATPLHKPISVVMHEMEQIEPPQLHLSEPEESNSVESTQEGAVQEQKASDPSLKEVIIQAKREMKQEGLSEYLVKKTMDEKITKAKHKEEVLKKHKELTEKGIKPESLLTKENLSKWLGEGMSYMRIARECVGISENEIAALAKTFGLQSDMKKYIVMKKGSK